MKLRDGSQVLDPRLDRLVQFDEQSRDYPVRRTAERRHPRSYTWSFRPATHPPLDQGEEGACVGFTAAHWLLARPRVVAADAALALDAYHRAQHNDPWPGCYLGPNCPVQPSSQRYDGTSVLAGVKELVRRGHVREYQWAFSLDDLILSVARVGPAFMGLNWYEGMFAPDLDGYVKPTGRLMGGHAILVTSVNVRGEFFRFPNSWGPDWHKNHGGNTTLRAGHARISFADMEGLMYQQGEACILLPTGA